MKTLITLENHTILYDNDCPLCNLYTSTFINTKMLDAQGRKPFAQITKEERSFIDVKKATNEIALVDRENKKVLYGIDSLLRVIGNRFPIIEKIGNIKFINFFLRKAYSLVSYNRKVIIPSEKKQTTVLECVPDFNIKYRLFYIFLSVVITGYTLFHFSGLIEILPVTNFKSELLLAFSQLIFQGLFLIKKDSKTILNYMGNLMTVSLIGCIGLAQMLLLNWMFPLPQIVILISFLGVVGVMFFEHKRRVTLLELPNYLTYTWVVYRLIALLLILNL